jgi:ABC-type nitrate/sulfonate/bicarbonate transport system substrate-binding protein
MITTRWLSRLGAVSAVAAMVAMSGASVFSNDAPGARPLTLQLDWRLNAQFAGILVAEQAGLYRAAGLAVEIRPLGDVPYAGLAHVVAETDGMIGSIEGGLFLSGRADGLPIVAIGTMFQASPLGLISLETSRIATPADLVGRHVAIHGDGHEALDAVLNAAGIDRAQLRISEASYGMKDLLEGKFDAKQGYLVDELVTLRRDGHAVRALEYRVHGHRAYSQVYFVSERTLAGHREELKTFLAASGEGWRRAAADPAATAAMIHERYAGELTTGYLEASLRLVVPLLSAEQPLLGAMTEATWDAQLRSLTRARPHIALPPMRAWVDLSMVDPTKAEGEFPGEKATTGEARQ